MKNSLKITVAAAAFTALLTTGCQSTKVEITDYSPVAIITVYGNADMPWYEKNVTSDSSDTSSGILSQTVSKLTDPNNPETLYAKNRIDEAVTVIEDRLSAAGVDFISKETITESSIYKYASTDILGFMDTDVAADGYSIMSSSGAKRNRELCIETGAACTLYFTFTFKKVKINVGSFDKAVKAMVDMKVSGYDASGKKIISETYSAVSDSQTQYKNGAWNRQAVCDFVKEAVDKDIDAFVSDFTSEESAVENADKENASETDNSTDESEDFVYTGKSTSISLPVPASAEKPSEEDSSYSSAENSSIEEEASAE